MSHQIVVHHRCKLTPAANPYGIKNVVSYLTYRNVRFGDMRSRNALTSLVVSLCVSQHAFMVNALLVSLRVVSSPAVTGGRRPCRSRTRPTPWQLLSPQYSGRCYMSNGDGGDFDGTNGGSGIPSDDDDAKNPIEAELEELQQQLAVIEALEARNEAQLDSFVDEEDQWNSLEEEERIVLRGKDFVVQRIEVLSEELIRMWMGAKSMDG